MRMLKILVISLLLLACSDTVENADVNPVDSNNGLNLNFNLKNASDPILAVAGLLESDTEEDMNFDFSIDDDVASYSMEHIASGTWTLSINAYSNVDKSVASLRYTGSEEFTVVAGQRTTLSITLDPTTGELDVSVSWGYTASVDLNINLANQNQAVTKYTYTLDHASLPDITADLAVTSGAEKITARLDDVPQGNWNLTIAAKNSSNTVVDSKVIAVNIVPGTITKVQAFYTNNELTLNDSQVPDVAGKSYIGDEAFRKYLILEKGFVDLREPYILNKDAETIQFLELNYEGDNYYYKYGSVHQKGFQNQLNLDAISAFSNLKELKINGFRLNKLVTDNHPNLLNVELMFTSASYVDLAGAPNLVALNAGFVSINWIDISQNSALLDLQVNLNYEKQSSGLFYEPEFTHIIGSIYIDPAMASNEVYTETGYDKFVDASFDTDSTTVAIPDDDAKRALLAYNFTMLKSNNVLVSETGQMTDFLYPEEAYTVIPCKGCKTNQKGIGPLNTYQPLYSAEVLKLFPNLVRLELMNQRIQTLDLSMNDSLAKLLIDDVETLTSLDLSNNPKLGILGGARKTANESKTHQKGSSPPFNYQLFIEDAELLKSINFGNQDNLTEIHIVEGGLTSIDLSGLSNLQNAYLSENKLSSITFGSTKITGELDLSYNQFETIDLSSQTTLFRLLLEGNSLTTMDVSSMAALTYLYLDNNTLTTLDVSGLANLYWLDADNNGSLTTVTFSGNTDLYSIYARNAALTSLDVSGLTNLTYIYANNNNISSVTFSSNSNLYYMDIQSNQLTSIDLAGLSALRFLYMQNNLLTGTLDISDIYVSPTVYTTGNLSLSEIYYDGNCNGQSIATVFKDVGTTFNGGCE